MRFDAENISGTLVKVGATVGGKFYGYDERRAILDRIESDKKKLKEVYAEIAALTPKTPAVNAAPNESGGLPPSLEDEKTAGSQNERFNTAMQRAHERYLSALETEVTSIDRRLDIELQRLADDKKVREGELARMVKGEQLTAAQAEQISIEEQKARDARADQLRVAAARAKSNAAAQHEGAMADSALVLMHLQEQLAVTVEERFRLQKQILEAERAEARNKLEGDLATNPNLTPAQRAAELVRFDAVTQGQRDVLSDQQSGLRLAFRTAFHDGVADAIQNGNPFALLTGFFGSLADHFADKVQDRLADDLFDMFDQLWSGKSTSGGGWVASALSGIRGLFGSGHASGGPVRAGVTYPVNERGWEVFRAGQDGYVLSHEQSVGNIAGEVAKLINPGTVLVSHQPPKVEVHNHGEPLTVAAQQYDPASNTMRIDLRRDVSRAVSSSVESGDQDGAVASRYGLSPVLKRRM